MTRRDEEEVCERTRGCAARALRDFLQRLLTSCPERRSPHPEMKALDAELSAFGGVARAIMDDVYAIAPANVVFPAVLRFERRLRWFTQLQLQPPKSTCWSKAYDLTICPWRRLANIPIGHVTANGIQGDGEYIGFGVVVGGIPVGDAAYVKAVVNEMADQNVSYITNTVTKLQTDRHGSFALNHHCCQSKFDYVLQHVPPEHTLQPAQRVDVALATAVEAHGYTGMFENDEITMRRMHLPIRERGLGIRSREWLAPIAYCANFTKSSLRFLDTRNEAGDVLPGFFPLLQEVFGDEPFATGGRSVSSVAPVSLACSTDIV